MKVNNTNRETPNRIKKQDQNGQFSIEILKQKIITHLKTHTLASNFTEQLRSITNIDILIEKFWQISSTSQTTQQSLPTIQKQLLFYKERMSDLERKIKDLNSQVLKQMKQISNKQSEIFDREAQIFQLKQAIEEKQRNIIRLTKTLRSKKAAPLSSSIEKVQKKEQQIKIVVNTPKVALKSQKVEKSDSKPLMQQNWQEQKTKLLRVIKEKDLKIYELLQQLEAKG